MYKFPPFGWRGVQTAHGLLILLCMESINASICLTGMLFRSSNNTFRNQSRMVGVFRRHHTLVSFLSHRCSIGYKSGLHGDQSSRIMLCKATKLWQTLATWGLHYHALKSIDVAAQELLLWVVILPAVTINCGFPLAHRTSSWRMCRQQRH